MLEKLNGAIYGALVGDALGVPYEFHNTDLLPARTELEMEPPVGFNRAHKGTPIGTWSDDGALMLALTASLAHNPSLDLNDFARRMCSFMTTGEYAVDRRVFDIGFQTQQGLAEFIAGTSPYHSGGSDVRDNGNGALMRVLPVAFLVCEDKEAIRIAMEQGRPTHGHIRSQIGCAMYVVIARRLIKGYELAGAIQLAEASLQRHIDPVYQAELEFFLTRNRKVGKGTGYVVDSFWSAIDSLEQTVSYEEAMQYAVSLGNDTDTTACIAGGLAGIMYGYDTIPQRWIDALRWKAYATDIMNVFAEKVLT